MTASDGRPSSTRMRSRYSDLDGQTHWLEASGPDGAPALVAVHGLGGSHVNWLAVAPLLAQDYHVYAIDLAGHGRTVPDHRGTRVAHNQLLLHQFLRTVVREPATLLGNSMGGLISLREAAEHPETVRDLILLGPALPMAGPRLPDVKVAAGIAASGIPGLGPLALRFERNRHTPEEIVDEMLDVCCHDPARVSEEMVDALVAQARRRREYPGVDVAIERAARSTVSGVLGRRRYDRILGAVTTPVLILHGEDDRLVPVESSRRAAARRPEWTLVTRPDLGHMPQIEDPEWTVQQIRQWHASAGSG